MKLFVLTHCGTTSHREMAINHAPRVFKTLELAKLALKEEYNECIGEKDDIDDCELYRNTAYVLHRDASYDQFDIFEIWM